MSKLDDLKLMKKLDKSDMHHKITHMPEQIYMSYHQAVIHKPAKFPKIKKHDVHHVVICGMGGSAISGDIAQAMFNDSVPITVVRDYRLPYIDHHTLCIIISYSGNTEEAISCLEEAIEHNAIIAAITSGGVIKKLVNRKYLWIEVKDGFAPRASIGYLYSSLLKILEICDIIPDQNETVNELVATLMQKCDKLCNKTETKKNLAKSSAEAIFGKMPIIYCSNPDLIPVAYRWKCQINENAKYPAFYHTFPEMNHNEIEAWDTTNLSKNFIPIFLRRFDDDEQYKKRVDVFQDMLKKAKIKFLEFFGDGALHKDNYDEWYFDLPVMFSLIYLGDIISYYLAILNDVDPTAIKYIDY
jgi:glucose/mannose-6-phosphate isomerase